MAKQRNRLGRNGKSRVTILPQSIEMRPQSTALTRPLFYGGPDPITINKMEALVQNVRTLMRETHSRIGRVDPRRDLDAECGYPEYLTVDEYADLISKEPVAQLVNSIYPIESWKTQPKIYDSDDPDVITPFMEAWNNLPTQMGIEPSHHIQDSNNVLWPFLLNADILSGWGRYGVILIGFDDGKELSQPCVPRKGMKINFLQAFPEHMASISSFETDRKSRRVGLPTMYQVTFSDPFKQSNRDVNESYTTEYVHYSRIVHLTDRWHTESSSRVFAVPRCEPVLHPILDIRKVRGASAEMYYKGAFPGVHFGTHPQLGPDVDVNKEDLQDMYEEYINGLQRAIWTTGMTADSLAPQVVDPTPQIVVQLEAISIKTRTPKRVLMGSERGELSSADDRKDYNGKLMARQALHNGPCIAAPLVDRLINMGVLPKPRSPGYRHWWPDLASLSEAEKADILVKRTQAYGIYSSQGVDSQVPPRYYMTGFDQMSEEEADSIIKEQRKALSGQSETAAPLLGLVGGVDAILQMFDRFAAGSLSEDTLRQLIMLFYKVDEEKADLIIADGLPEPPKGSERDVPPLPPMKGPNAPKGPLAKTPIVANWLAKRSFPTINKVPSIRDSANTIYMLMDDITKGEAREIARTIKGGYLTDESVKSVAKRLETEIGLDPVQALVVAKTETARVATDDYITSASSEGVKSLVFKASPNACDICRGYDGKKFSINRAMGVIPVHPNCECSWQEPITGNVFCPTGPGGGIDPTCSPSTAKFKKEKGTNVYRTEYKGKIIEYENITLDVGKRRWIVRVDGEAVDTGDTKAEAEMWARKALEAIDEQTTNVFCPTGPGGGIDPTCSPGGVKGGIKTKIKQFVRDKVTKVADIIRAQTTRINEYLMFTGDPKIGGDIEMMATAVRSMTGIDKETSTVIGAAIVHGAGPIGAKLKKGIDYIDNKLYERIGDEPAPAIKSKLRQGTSNDPIAPIPAKKTYNPNVDAKDNEGITKAARVGVPALSVPPPPALKSLPNLTPREREVEQKFIAAVNKDPDGMARKFREIVEKGTKPGDPPTFGTDDAKVLHPAWHDDNLSPQERSQNRATLNTPLHQAANAIAKRAFIQHLDTLKPGDEVLVTVGGCGAGKGYALKNVPEALAMKQRSKAVWDSAGDQNATENSWLRKELKKRKLKGNFLFVHADPFQQWADPVKGVVKRAADPTDGRMVDAKVFADSYAIGARNHQKFYNKYKNSKDLVFFFIDNTGKPRAIPGIPAQALSLDRKALARYAIEKVMESDAPAHVKRGATMGTRIWEKD